MLPLLLLGVVATSTPARIGFQEALELGLRHPALTAADRAVDGLRTAARALPDVSQGPSVQVLPGARLPGADAAGLELQVTATLPLPLDDRGPSGRRWLDREAERRATARHVEVQARRLEIALAWLDRRAAERRVERLRAETAVVEALVAGARRAVEAGAALAEDLAEAELLAAELEAGALDAEGLSFETGAILARALATDPRDPTEGARAVQLGTRGPFFEPPLPDPRRATEWLEHIDRDPTVRAVRAEAARAAADGERLAAERGPRWSVGVQLQRESPGDLLMFAGLGVQLGWPGVGSAEAAEASAAETAARGRAVASARSRARELALALHEVEHRRELEAQLRSRWVPAAERLAALRQRALDAGQAVLAETLLARRRALEARARLETAEAARRRAEIAAWILLAPLTDPEDSTDAAPR